MTVRRYLLWFYTTLDGHRVRESKVVEAIDVKDAIEIAQRQFGPSYVFDEAQTIAEREA